MRTEHKLIEAYKLLQLAADLAESAGWPVIAVQVRELANVVDTALRADTRDGTAARQGH